MPRLKLEPSPHLGTGDAALYLGVGRSTLTLWRRRGEIRPTAVVEGPSGPNYKFSRSDLDEFRKRIDFDA